MGNLIVVSHISLDGFVAGSKGELDGFEADEENLQFVCTLTENADAALFGRISFELLHSYWPTAASLPGATSGQIQFSNWYNSAQKIVISRQLSSQDATNATVINQDIRGEVRRLKQMIARDILVFGSPTVCESLIEFDLIDSYWIFVNPVVFGEGIRLFGKSAKEIKLKLGATRQFANGELALHYSNRLG